MWLFAREGFVSVVKDRYCKDGEVVVRARVREDLVSILEKLGGHKPFPEILEFDHADYRFRAIVDQHDFMIAVSRLVLEINYSNFKNVAAPLPGDRARHEAYMGCWVEMNRLQDRGVPRGEKDPFWETWDDDMERIDGSRVRSRRRT